MQSADNATVRLDWDNEPQPDALLRILPDLGGPTRNHGGYLEGPPEWVGEVAASRASYDLHDKKEVYRRHGVQEYVVWRVEDQAVDWFLLDAGRYESLPRDTDGVSRSRTFPGLWLDTQALVNGDMRRVLEVLQSGVTGAEHDQFVAALRSAGAD